MTAAGEFSALLSHAAERPVPLVRLAHLLLAKGKGEWARELCARAVALAPDNAEVQAFSSEIFSHKIPGWYFPMVRDRLRHAAVENALRRAIRPGCRVLEIGTGTGLFAMMAARAGAGEVVTCERNPAVAAVASEIIARNGFADRVRVIVKSSADLEVRADLAEPADLLIWDVLSNDMIGAGALPIIEQTMRRLVRQHAPAIPARGRIRVALVDDKEAVLHQMHAVENFDLSLFNRLAAPSYAVLVGDKRLALRSKPADLFQFDFQSGGPFPEGRTSVQLNATGGHVNGIVQWLSFEMDDENWYENMPSVDASSAFAVRVYPLLAPIEMRPGCELRICGVHDRFSLRVWAEPNR
jgi:type III protein arginine methyltransferase